MSLPGDGMMASRLFLDACSIVEAKTELVPLKNPVSPSDALTINGKMQKKVRQRNDHQDGSRG